MPNPVGARPGLAPTGSLRYHTLVMKRLIAASLVISTALILGAGCAKKGEPVRTATMPKIQKQAPPTPPPNIPVPTPVQPQ